MLRYGQRNKDDWWHGKERILRLVSTQHPARRALALLYGKMRKTTKASREDNVQRKSDLTGRDAGSVAYELKHTYKSTSMREVAFFPRPPEMLKEAKLIYEMFPATFPAYKVSVRAHTPARAPVSFAAVAQVVAAGHRRRRHTHVCARVRVCVCVCARARMCACGWVRACM